MKHHYSLIEPTRREDSLVVGFRFPRMDENQINTLYDELLDAGKGSGCRKFVLRFGPRPVECLYSVFLAKLITLQRLLAMEKIGLLLCELHPSVRSVFQACKLESYFLIANTLEDALALPLPDPLPGQLAPPCSRPHCGGLISSDEGTT